MWTVTRACGELHIEAPSMAALNELLVSKHGFVRLDRTDMPCCCAAHWNAGEKAYRHAFACHKRAVASLRGIPLTIDDPNLVLLDNRIHRDDCYWKAP